MKKSSTNLTEGNIAGGIILFAVPIFLGQLFQNLYNSIDSIVVGRYVGTTALAAVASCGDIAQLLTGFFTGLSIGTGVLFSRCFGAKEYEKLHRVIHTALLFSMILGAVMAALGIILTPQLLRVVRCPSDVWDEACLYLRIYLVGIFFTAVYNVGSGVLRAVGDSRSPLIYLILSSMVNIILDVFLVAVLKMGVVGVAVATIVSQMTSVVLVFHRMLTTDDVYHLCPKDLKIDRSLLLEIMGLGLPAAIQASLTSISNLFVQRYINSFGSSAMAGIGAAKKIDRFAGLVGQSIGLASATFVSQNLGAKRIKRTYRGIRICLLLSLMATLIMGIPVYLFAERLSQIFTPDSEAIYYSVKMIHIMVPFFYFHAMQEIFSNAVRSFGKSRQVMVLAMLGMIVCRQVYLAVSLSVNHCVENVALSFPVGWMTGALFVIGYYALKIRPVYKEESA